MKDWYLWFRVECARDEDFKYFNYADLMIIIVLIQLKPPTYMISYLLDLKKQDVNFENIVMTECIDHMKKSLHGKDLLKLPLLGYKFM
jgi:hypothetical protein